MSSYHTLGLSIIYIFTIILISFIYIHFTLVCEHLFLNHLRNITSINICSHNTPNSSEMISISLHHFCCVTKYCTERGIKYCTERGIKYCTERGIFLHQLYFQNRYDSNFYYYLILDICYVRLNFVKSRNKISHTHENTLSH